MSTAAVRVEKDRKMTSADENILSLYLKEINKIPLLTRSQEENLARAAAKGEQSAKDKLIRANLRFVVNVAKKYQNQGLPLADLISEGNIGLMNAIERFDVEKGYHFISYAVWWIRQAILKAICEKSRMIRLPLNRANELVQIEKVRKDVQSEGGSRSETDGDRAPPRRGPRPRGRARQHLARPRVARHARSTPRRTPPCSATSWRTAATRRPRS